MSCYGKCANSCSGHGICTNYRASFASGRSQQYAIAPVTDTIVAAGYDTSIEKKDSCTCHISTDLDNTKMFAYRGADCSIKTCPSGNMHFGLPYATNDHTQRAECSGAGTCVDGKCRCNPGYAGASCSRATCPNGCSQRGKCMSLRTIARAIQEDTTVDYVDYSAVEYSMPHDADSSYGCFCDPGSHGADCSLSRCQSSENPMGGKGAAEGMECSGQGICNANLGECNCFPGFVGTDCGTSQAYATS